MTATVRELHRRLTRLSEHERKRILEQAMEHRFWRTVELEDLALIEEALERRRRSIRRWRIGLAMLAIVTAVGIGAYVWRDTPPWVEVQQTAEP